MLYISVTGFGSPTFNRADIAKNIKLKQNSPRFDFFENLIFFNIICQEKISW